MKSPISKTAASCLTFCGTCWPRKTIGLSRRGRGTAGGVMLTSRDGKISFAHAQFRARWAFLGASSHCEWKGRVARPMVPAMSLRRFRFPKAAMFVAAAAALSATTIADAGSAKRPVVVELYTSQGCSSCPPADAILAQLATRKDVIAMSLPITYWDMLGWKDTLASEADTKRQKAYAQAMWRGGVYTPQIIVDGVNDVVGGRDAQIEAMIAARWADEQ